MAIRREHNTQPSFPAPECPARAYHVKGGPTAGVVACDGFATVTWAATREGFGACENDGQTQRSLPFDEGFQMLAMPPKCGWTSTLILLDDSSKLADPPATDRRRAERSGRRGTPSGVPLDDNGR